MKLPEELIFERIAGLTSHLENSPCATELSQQRHLDGGTLEQAYWHDGYRSALIDVLRILQSADVLARRTDSEADCPLAVQDEKSFH